MLNRWVLSRDRKTTTEGAEVTRSGRLFQTRAAVTGKARSPTVTSAIDWPFCPIEHISLSVLLNISAFLSYWTYQPVCPIEHIGLSVLLHISAFLSYWTYQPFCPIEHISLSVLLNISAFLSYCTLLVHVHVWLLLY